MRLLGDVIAHNNRAWPNLNEEQRAAARRRFVDDGWTVCPHTDCPPWDCQITNPPHKESP